MKQRIIYVLCLVASLAVMQSRNLQAADENVRPTIDDVWLYLPMNGSVQATVGDHVVDIQYRQWTTNALTTNVAPSQMFAAGLAGQAWDVSGPKGDRPGDALAYLLDVRTFPTHAGTMALWYKPSRVLRQETVWLYGMGWVRFQAQISGNRLGVHVTSENRHAIYSSLKPNADTWPDKWHLIVSTWDGSTVRVFVDGQMIGERLDTKPLDAAPSSRLDIGSLPPGGGRKTPVAYAHGMLDDIVLLSKPLSPTQVMDLYRAGQTEGFDGFLGTLPTGALVTMRRHAYVRGEKVEALVTPFAGGADGRLIAIDGSRRIELGSVATGEISRITIDTSQLRPGTYTLAAELPDSDGRLVLSGKSPLIIRDRRQPEFPVGLGGEFGSTEETLALYERLHISHLSSNGPQGDIYFWKQLDRAFAHGISLFPNFNILGVWSRQYDSLKQEPYFRKDEQGKWRLNKEWGWKFLQTLVFADGSEDDHRVTSSASPFSPIALKMMTARIKQIMTVAGDHPGLMAVSFQDEVPFRTNVDKETGKWKIGDYSYYAVEHFKKVSGLDAPAFPPTDPEGTVWPDSHPYLQWAEYIGLPGNDFTTVGFEDLYYRLAQEVKSYRPDVLVGNYSGGEYGKNDFVLDWNYPVIWAPHPWSWGAGGSYLDFVFDRHWARQDARPRKPLWALLGWWSGNMAEQPDWCVADFRLNTAWALAKGCKHLMWFAASHGPLETDKSGPFSHPEIRAELEKWTTVLHEKGAVFAQLEKRPAGKTAVLWSKTNRAGHVLKTKDKAEYYLVFAGLRNIGATPDVITDQMIREGVLDGYEALVLCGFNYSSESLWKKINAFADREGTTVFHDESSKLIPPGSVPLGLKWSETFEPQGGPLMRTRAVGKWANHLRPIVRPHLSRADLEVEEAGGMVGAHLLWAGKTPYLFIINTDVEQARSAVVRYKHEGLVAYNLISGTATPLQSVEGRIKLAVDLEPGGVAIFVLPDGQLKKVQLDATWKAGRLTVDASAMRSQSEPLAAAWPIRIEVLDPDGERAYERWTSTDQDGGWHGNFQLGRMTDEAGIWQVRVTDILTKRVTHKDVSVKW